ncbi:hypothetical protein BJ508DRAFT_418365 [Ascobolus immersus RN42]|uniref:3-hydroxyisobutyrate dehydrogenase n=1 Tax=Ascobolus immersus RN42 TaxID=1160509 RepID=A0A3N4HM76_ASCIM|nr:hypothetical protein BJ508DRAFT_418365 [Ascobolus immersus RN42]
MRSAFLRPVTRFSGIRLFSSSVSRDASWGFIGLGRMGYPMAKNLRLKVPKEDTLLVFDVNAASSEALVKELGADRVKVAKDVREVAEESDTIITMLPEPHHVKGVFGELFAMPIMPSPGAPQKLFIDCSTIDPTTSTQVGEMVRNSYMKAEFVDAPVSGGVVGAEAGTLTFMLGAPDSIVPRVESVLQHMGKRTLHCGKPGTGIVGKLANNYILAMENIAVAEAFNFGTKMGLDAQVLKDLVGCSTGKCWSNDINNPVDNAKKDFVGGFGISLMRKDLGLAVAAAEKAKAKLLIGRPALEAYEAVEKVEECKGRDFSVVYRYLGGEEKK